jgi:hypothetical protein
LGTYPSIAVLGAELGPQAEARFTTLSVSIPIGDPSQAIAMDAGASAGCRMNDRPIRCHLCAKLLSAQNLIKGFDDWALYIDGKSWAHEDLSPNFHILCRRLTHIESKNGSTNQVRIVPLNNASRDLYRMYPNLGAMSGDEFFTRKFNLIVLPARLREIVATHRPTVENAKIKLNMAIGSFVVFSQKDLHSSCLYPVFLAAS